MLPIAEASGQAAGLASKTVSGHACCSVESRVGSCLGKTIFALLMFACPGGEKILRSTLAPMSRTVRACVLVRAIASSFGVKGSVAQLATSKGLETAAVTP